MAEALIIDANASLQKSKARLNGIYGMVATDVVRLNYTMDPETGEWTHTELTQSLIEESLASYYKKRSSCLARADRT